MNARCDNFNSYSSYKSYHPSVYCYPATTINAATDAKAYECLKLAMDASAKDFKNLRL